MKWVRTKSRVSVRVGVSINVPISSSATVRVRVISVRVEKTVQLFRTPSTSAHRHRWSPSSFYSLAPVQECKNVWVRLGSEVQPVGQDQYCYSCKLFEQLQLPFPAVLSVLEISMIGT